MRILILVLLGACLAPGAPPQVVVGSALDFGTVVAREEAGAFVLDARGGRAWTGGLGPGPGSPAPARLDLTGPPGAAFALRFTPEPLLLRGLRITGFQAIPDGGAAVFDGAGRATVRVGATLAAEAGVARGAMPAAAVWAALEVAGEAPAAAPIPMPIRGRILQALGALEVRAMDFGRILVPREEVQVRLEPGGGRVAAGPALLLPGGGAAAQFDLRGEDGMFFSIHLPQRAFLSGPGEPLELEDFRPDPPSARGRFAGGRARVGVGATLRLRTGQKPGTYRGTYRITFAYE